MMMMTIIIITVMIIGKWDNNLIGRLLYVNYKHTSLERFSILTENSEFRGVVTFVDEDEIGSVVSDTVASAITWLSLSKEKVIK